jgi:death-on-curing protein
MPSNPVIKPITVKQVETVTHSLAQELMLYDEPIPEFSTRFPNKLESCLFTPFQKFGGRALYRGIIGKGSTVFYLMIKNHPFQNGNKRIAVMTLFYFLFINGWWLDVSNDELYEFSVRVAKSEAADHMKVRSRIMSFLRKHKIKR